MRALLFKKRVDMPQSIIFCCEEMSNAYHKREFKVVRMSTDQITVLHTEDGRLVNFCQFCGSEVEIMPAME